MTDTMTKSELLSDLHRAFAVLDGLVQDHTYLDEDGADPAHVVAYSDAMAALGRLQDAIDLLEDKDTRRLEEPDTGAPPVKGVRLEIVERPMMVIEGDEC